jgi:hypothetical protein
MALLDTKPGDSGVPSIYMSEAEFIEYQSAKKIYEKWQATLAHRHRYGW